MKRLIALTILMILSLPVAAEEVVLKCVDSSGQSIDDLRLDVENRTMIWGRDEFASDYDIYHVSDTYISAHSNSKRYSQNSDVWVINRITGEYVRALAGLFHTEKDKDSELRTATFSGSCAKQKF